ncbi:16S rRNA (cytosine1402-N4)-methyltransferase [Pseudobacteriovorax antillogorgiicola]|uniref:Ribosomal RNA small subunit methyltransferase H n=2 Tax=Pseudobacteriovorax antillogorgiicola TaxID=1513793 RepID=A0A1Y6B8G1_9BACT|nr:16S rRNA (cytosine1402-N4)-methyltransferase [Pseudobacteriovorax antillogorgiicola]SME90968.1 16S rRNA (cytosine1402-N4)-methyltransferase [Pseudobacteriovorax antillogorgiicola]
MFDHITVLKNEMVQSLNLPVDGIAIDCTAGGGGHTAALLDALGPGGKVFAFDRDPMAFQFLSERFAKDLATKRLVLCPNPFSEIQEVAEKYEIAGKIDGICADIGVSSPQLDLGERGFSFNKDGPLDMRMDTSSGDNAAHVINEYNEQELADIIYKFGEEPKSRFVARAIVQERSKEPITNTLRLAEIVANAIHYKTKSKKHPATKTFQALRIYVNQELEELETLCRDGFDILKPGGRIGIITFHSLEDKFVKQYFNTLGKGKKIPAHLSRAPLTEDQVAAYKDVKGKIVKPFPLIPSEEEQSENPRSRSAKLRTIEKL